MSEYDTPLGSIKVWAEEDRPREKLMIKGRHALTDAELLAILLGSGSRNESAIGLAQKILAHANNDLSTLAKMSAIDLQKIKGIGEAKALNIMAALELGRRRKEISSLLKPQMNTSKDVFNELEGVYKDLQHEEFWVLFLNRANRIIAKKCLSRGGINGTVVDIRLLMKSAIDMLTSGIIISHNHPSGNLYPSEEDLAMTRKCKQACEYLDIRLLDHLIVADDKYYSFQENGVL